MIGWMIEPHFSRAGYYGKVGVDEEPSVFECFPPQYFTLDFVSFPSTDFPGHHSSIKRAQALLGAIRP